MGCERARDRESKNDIPQAQSLGCLVATSPELTVKLEMPLRPYHQHLLLHPHNALAIFHVAIAAAPVGVTR